MAVLPVLNFGARLIFQLPRVLPVLQSVPNGHMEPEDKAWHAPKLPAEAANAADRADAYCIDEFCARHRISPQLFYKLKPQGLMPVTFNVGTRVLISREAAAAWRRERENAAR